MTRRKFEKVVMFVLVVLIVASVIGFSVGFKVGNKMHEATVERLPLADSFAPTYEERVELNRIHMENCNE